MLWFFGSKENRKLLMISSKIFHVSVEKAIFFGFERKTKVVSNFVQKFSCGPPLDQHQTVKILKL